jgi:hypothetical protein
MILAQSATAPEHFYPKASSLLTGIRIRIATPNAWLIHWHALGLTPPECPDIAQISTVSSICRRCSGSWPLATKSWLISLPRPEIFGASHCYASLLTSASRLSHAVMEPSVCVASGSVIQCHTSWLVWSPLFICKALLYPRKFFFLNLGTLLCFTLRENMITESFLVMRLPTTSRTWQFWRQKGQTCIHCR